jgi:hypothetical protein
LLFDQFGVRRVELDVLMWPGFGHGFKHGELSALYGRLNTDDLFESCELKANVGAEFESEHWTFDISTTRISLTSEAFQSFPELDKRMLHLLEETRQFFQPRLPYLIAERVSVRGVIPEDAQRDVGEMIRSKLLTRRVGRADDAGDRPLDLMPGQLTGTGVTIVGDTERYHWHANIGPAHAYPMLPISADLYFPPPEERPDGAMISESLATAYEFVTSNIVEFAHRILG